MLKMFKKLFKYATVCIDSTDKEIDNSSERCFNMESVRDYQKRNHIDNEKYTEEKNHE